MNRSVRNKAQRWVFEALEHVVAGYPFPIVGIDSDNGSEFINDRLLRWCIEHQMTFTRSRPGNKNDGAHVEQKNWARVRELVGYDRYDTASELTKLNEIWDLDALFTDNYFLPSAETVRKWIRHAQVDAGQRPGITVEESAELKRLRREVAELRRANEILKSAAAFFGVELDRPQSRS